MNAGKNQRALLVEIMVAVLFFGLCATVLLQTFMAAREGSRRAGVQSVATVEMQSLAEQLYGAEAVDPCLTEAGFSLEGDAWIRAAEDYVIRAVPEVETTESGAIRTVRLEAVLDGETLVQLDSVRYLPGEVTP